jgi:glycosyl transferase family 87
MIKTPWILLACACGLFIGFGGWRALVKDRARDFAPVYGGARCLLNGCNPYDTNQLDRQLVQGGAASGDIGSWKSEMPVYPPSTFLVVVPVAKLPYRLARIVWFGISSVLFCLAGFAVLQLCSRASILVASVMMSMVVASSTGGLGNPGIPAIGLAAVAIWLFVRTKRWVLASLILAISIAVKPHVCGPLLVWTYFRTRYRIACWTAAVLSSLLLFVPVVSLERSPSSAFWFDTLRSNLAGADTLGGINDPSLSNADAARMTNLQTVFAIIGFGAQGSNAAAWIITGACLTAWLLAVLRNRNSDDQPLFGIASLVCVTLLPVYHRLQDARLLVLSVPALVWLLTNRRVIGFLAAALTVPALFSVSFQFDRFFLAGAMQHSLEHSNVLLQLLFLREAPLAVLGLTIIYLWVFWHLGMVSNSDALPHDREASIAAGA